VIVGILFSLRYREVRYRPEAVSKQLGRDASAAVATS